MDNELIVSTLGEVCFLVTDGTHDTPKRVVSGYPLIKATEIGGGQLNFESCDQISEADHRKIVMRSKPEFGDTLFAHIGASLGEAAFVNAQLEFSIKNIALFKPNPAVINPRYLYYLVVSPQFQALAKGMRTGSAQPFLGLSQLRAHPICYHRDIAVQERIAGILSAYDELIENNQRRIKILESMARAIYSEWFVKFRFPGSESISCVHSPLGDIPKGWEAIHIGKLAKVVLGGTPSRSVKEYWEGGGIPWLKSGRLNDKRVIEGTEFITKRGLEMSSAKLMPPKTVLVAITGAILISFLEIEACANQSVIGIYDSKRVSPEYLHAYLRENISVFESKMSGSAQQHINKEIVEQTLVLVPSEKITHAFGCLVEPLYNEVAALLFKSRNLKKTRDLLLPRLLSGQVNFKTL